MAVAAALSGCIYDAAKPRVGLDNTSRETVIVFLEGEQLRFENSVPSGMFGEIPTDKCLGTAIVVEAEDGEPVGRVEEPACPGWTLTINADGTLDYTED